MAQEGELYTPIKMVIVGSAASGKTRLVQRLCQNTWDEDAAYKPTIAIDLQSKIVYLGNGRDKVRFSFWDTSGQPRFEAVTKNYYQHTDVFLFVFDASNPQETLEDCLKRFYRKEWLQTANPNPFLALVACKFDANPNVLRDNPDLMRQIEATGMPLFWTSSREGKTQDILQTAGHHVMALRRAKMREERVMDNLYLIPKPLEERPTCTCILL
jgi:small GTP-binding protein